MSSVWYQISCTVPASLTDAAADFLSELTGCGVCTDNRAVDTFSTGDIPEQTETTITGYLAAPCPIEEHAAALLRYLQDCSASLPGYRPAPPQIQLIGEEDWAGSWKAHFKPLPIGRRLLILPTWEQPAAAEQRQVVTLDPGMAFGTGGHETTRLCLECLETILDALQPHCPDPALLDLGTGSGILAIAAAKLGVRTIEAVDIDPQAVLVAEENCALNGVADQVHCSVTPLEQLNGSYHLILANILAEELVRLAPHLLERLQPEGYLVLSGILGERERYVIDGFAPYPLQLEAVTADGEWRCLRYRRQP